MKQQINILLSAAFCVAAFCSCSKHTSKPITAGNTPVNTGISLNKGQKLQIENTVNTVNTMELMGQAMEISADVITKRQLEVKDKKEKSFVIAATLTNMTINGSAMGQTMNYDSDKKEDTDSEMGKMMKDQINVPKEVELNEKGKVINVKKDTAKTSGGDENPMMAMINNMGGGQEDNNGVHEAFQVLEPGVKTGDSWTDSTIVDGAKTFMNYTVKSIVGNDATITLTGSQAINKKMEAQGMETNITLDTKLAGEILVDKTTGIVKQRTLTMEGTGSADAMGQAIPMTTKVTTVSVVKSL